MKKRFALDENEGVLGLSALNFDLSIFDIFGSIYMGGFLSLVKDPRNAYNDMEFGSSNHETVFGKSSSGL